MNCNEFQRALETAILERAAPANDVIEHGRTCAAESCRAAWQDFRLLEQTLPIWSEAEQPRSERSVETIVAAAQESTGPVTIVAPPRSADMGNGFARWLAVAIAGCVIIGLITALGRLPKGNELVVQPAPQPAPEELLVNDPSRPVPPTQPLVTRDNDALAAMGEHYVTWLSGSADQITNAVAVVLGEQESEPEPMRESPAWLQSIKHQWQPLEDSLQQSLKSLIEGGMSEGDSAT
ncbi:MAG: hypothetical protein KDA58_08295 [Planctomycetaceae bacterium]|nr:hypothetical protein [Planctomycetaceae bacterium]